MIFTAGLWINLDKHGKLVGFLTSKISCLSEKFVLQFMSATLNGRVCYNSRLLHLSSVWKHYVANTLEAGRMPVSTKYSLAKATVCTYMYSMQIAGVFNVYTHTYVHMYLHMYMCLTGAFCHLLSLSPPICYCRISLCSMPGDPYNMVDMLRVWLNQPLSWYHEKQQQQVLQAFLCERAAFVHIALKGHSLISKHMPSQGCGLV